MLAVNANAYYLYGEDKSTKSTSYGTLANFLYCTQESSYPTGYREFDSITEVDKDAPKLWFEVEAIPYPTGGKVVDQYSSWEYNVKHWGGYLESHHWSDPKKKVSVYGCGEVRNASNTYAKAVYTAIINV